jgi:hypothetical protein
VRLRVEPGLVRGVIEPHWIQAKLLAITGRHPTNAQTRHAEGTVVPSEPLLDALPRTIDTVLAELAGASALQGLWLDVELADSLVHLDVVGGDFAGDSDRQLQSVAAACVAELLGDATRDHEIRWQLQSDEKHLLIGAIARDLLGALGAAALRHGLSLRSVQPDICLQWNRHASAALTAPGAAVFAVASANVAVIASVADGNITALSSGGWIDRQRKTGALDSRADRLLASAGLDPLKLSNFVLVGPKGSDKVVSPRWKVWHWAVQSS